MSKILLIFPSQLYAPYWGEKTFIKAHLLNLFSFLKSKNHKVKILDLEIEIGRPTKEEEISEFKRKAYKLISGVEFDVAGISCWSSINYISSIMVAKICKMVNSNCIIAVGGYHPTARPADFLLKERIVDFIIRGEGEIAFNKICVQKEKTTGEPTIINGIPLDLTKDFWLDWKGYKYCELSNEIPVYLSRGCPFSCTFCMETSKEESRSWRSYPMDIALNTIKGIADYMPSSQISITDACFGYSKTWRKKFLRKLKRTKVDQFFWFETRIDILDKNDIDLFANLHCELQLGIESGSPEMLKIMNKTGNPQGFIRKCKDVIDYMNNKEIPFKLLFLFNHPGETFETYSSTIDFLKSLIRDQKKISGIIGAQTFSYFPGSYVSINLREYHQKFGTIIQNKEWWKQKGDHYLLSTSIIPSERLIKKLDNLNYFKKDIDELNEQIFEKMPDRLKTFWISKM